MFVEKRGAGVLEKCEFILQEERLNRRRDEGGLCIQEDVSRVWKGKSKLQLCLFAVGRLSALSS